MKLFKRIWQFIRRDERAQVRVDDVVIPRQDLLRLEDERIELWKIIDRMPKHEQVQFINITQAMYHLTHRKYKSAV